MSILVERIRGCHSPFVHLGAREQEESKGEERQQDMNGRWKNKRSCSFSPSNRWILRFLESLSPNNALSEVFPRHLKGSISRRPSIDALKFSTFDKQKTFDKIITQNVFLLFGRWQQLSPGVPAHSSVVQISPIESVFATAAEVDDDDVPRTI